MLNYQLAEVGELLCVYLLTECLFKLLLSTSH